MYLLERVGSTALRVLETSLRDAENYVRRYVQLNYCEEYAKADDGSPTWIYPVVSIEVGGEYDLVCGIEGLAFTLTPLAMPKTNEPTTAAEFDGFTVVRRYDDYFHPSRFDLYYRDEFIDKADLIEITSKYESNLAKWARVVRTRLLSIAIDLRNEASDKIARADEIEKIFQE